VLVSELGKEWQSAVTTFEIIPFAAASIGQVHRAVLHDGTEVAMKIQYPGVAKSIESDIDNLVGIMKIWNVFPSCKSSIKSPMEFIPYCSFDISHTKLVSSFLLTPNYLYTYLTHNVLFQKAIFCQQHCPQRHFFNISVDLNV